MIASGGVGDWTLVACWEPVPEKLDGIPNRISLGYVFPFVKVKIRG